MLESAALTNHKKIQERLVFSIVLLSKDVFQI